MARATLRRHRRAAVERLLCFRTDQGTAIVKDRFGSEAEIQTETLGLAEGISRSTWYPCRKAAREREALAAGASQRLAVLGR
jgi:hypothetical protein